MYRVRFYDHAFHPDEFKQGGLLGVTIVVLNWLRWRLETFTQRLVLRFLTKRGGLPRERESALRRIFDLDVRAERLAKEQTSPLNQPVAEDVDLLRATSRAERYAVGGFARGIEQAHVAEGGLPVRPTGLHDLASRYGSPPRQRRYARGHLYNVGSPDGDFEPVGNNGLVSSEEKS